MEKEHKEKMDVMIAKFTLEIERLKKSEAKHKADARELRQTCDEL
jgi:hypothetical protein